MDRKCDWCECSDECACVGGCSWVSDNRCSACEAFDKPRARTGPTRTVLAHPKGRCDLEQSAECAIADGKLRVRIKLEVVIPLAALGTHLDGRPIALDHRDLGAALASKLAERVRPG